MRGLEQMLRERQQGGVEGEKTLRAQKHKTRKVSEKVRGVQRTSKRLSSAHANDSLNRNDN